MSETWLLATLWLGMALIATLLSIWFGIATALSEIVVGTVAQLVIGALLGSAVLGGNDPWIKFLAGTGAIILTFLAGAELDPEVLKQKWKETVGIGLAGFFAPFLGCAAIAYYVLHWSPQASWLTGVALSTTSVAVVYAVMLEFGLNTTTYGKTILAACFVNDLGTVLALGLIFAPFTMKTVIFVVVSVVVFALLPYLTPRFFKRYGGRPSELEAKYLLLCLFGMGFLATWADSEAVLPAYLIGMVLAGTVGKDHMLIRRLRTLTFGLLTPFYFIRAGSFVLGSGAHSSPRSFPDPPCIQDGDEDRRRLSDNQGFQERRQRGNIHDTSHVDRPHLREHISPFRALAWNHRYLPVLLPHRHCSGKRSGPHFDCQCLFPAKASFGWCTEGGRKIRQGCANGKRNAPRN